jgi:hypothetical protein
MTAFVFAFLILLCDGADIGILAFSLTSLKAEWGLTSVQAVPWEVILFWVWGSVALLADGPVTSLDAYVSSY